MPLWYLNLYFSIIQVFDEVKNSNLPLLLNFNEKKEKKMGVFFYYVKKSREVTFYISHTNAKLVIKFCIGQFSVSQISQKDVVR